MQFAEQTAAGRFLDYGYGMGYAAETLGQKVDYTGVDVDPEAIAFARTKYGEFGEFEIVADNRAPFEDATFDSAASLEVVEHVPKADHDQFTADRLASRSRRSLRGSPRRGGRHLRLEHGFIP